MSDQKDQQNKSEFSVDEILAEYSSSSKVIEFPQDEGDFPDDPMPRPARKPRPVDEIVPETPLRGLAARIATLRRKADHYADHMYDQAETDEETLRAEKYIPGVDKEETPDEVPVRRRIRRPVKMPPDIPASDLAARYLKGLKGRGRRVGFSFVISLLSIPLSFDLSGGLPFALPEFLPFTLPADLFSLQCLVLAGLLFLVGALCFDILWQGLKKLVLLRPGAETLMMFAWAFTMADALTAALCPMEPRLNCLPCAAVTAFGLTFHLWGFQANQRGSRTTAKVASQTRNPYVVTLDENKWSGRPAYTKWSGTPVGFGSQMQLPDAGEQVYRVAAPLLLVVCFLCAVMGSVGQDSPGRFLWSASAIFTAVSAWSALLAYGVPYKKLALRLSKVGAALAGWAGVSRGRQGGIVTTDGDLFPPGAVRVAQVKVFGGIATEKAVAYTATLLRVLNCGLSRPFHDLLRTQGAFYREVSGVRPHREACPASSAIRRCLLAPRPSCT